jgi:gas vesicle protein
MNANSNRTYYSREAEVRATRERISLTVICLMFGLGIGTAMALLFAPTNGKQTRDELFHSLEEGVQNGRERIEPTVAKLEKEVNDLRKKVEERLS